MMKDSLGVFALPSAVLFPGATLPLHVFEPRYRALVRDAIAGDGIFAMALLKPGYEARYEDAPEIYPIGCAGRVGDVVPLPDGRYLLTLTGTRRVQFLDKISQSPYRCHRVQYLDEHSPDESAPVTRDAMLRLVSAHQQIVSILTGTSASSPILMSVPFAETVNRIAIGLDIDPAEKYRLLENGDLLARAETLVALLETALPGYLDMDDGLIN